MIDDLMWLLETDVPSCHEKPITYLSVLGRTYDEDLISRVLVYVMDRDHAFVYSLLQMLLGFYVPPANTWWALVLCIVLDYLVAFTIVGLAGLFAKPFGKYRLAGYCVGAVVVCLIRFVSSFLSGVILWGSYAPEGMNVWYYSLVYNASYMLPNAILTGVFAVVICAALDPKTLRPMKKKKLEEN